MIGVGASWGENSDFSKCVNKKLPFKNDNKHTAWCVWQTDVRSSDNQQTSPPLFPPSCCVFLFNLVHCSSCPRWCCHEDWAFLYFLSSRRSNMTFKTQQQQWWRQWRTKHPQWLKAKRKDHFHDDQSLLLLLLLLLLSGAWVCAKHI